MGYKLLRYPLGENADLGFVIKKNNDIVVFTNSCSRLSREIFTLAHEIGHVVLHLNEANSFVDDSITINGRSSDEKELSAMDIARIMSEFSVSFDMALNRLESLKVIGTDLKLRLDNAKTEI